MGRGRFELMKDTRGVRLRGAEEGGGEQEWGLTFALLLSLSSSRVG
jgi:hypothetical protein